MNTETNSVLDLLKGQRMKVMTDVGVEVEVVIKEVKQNFHSRDLAPATRENDWWPPQETSYDYTVTFTTGKSKTYSSLNDIKVLP